MPNIVSCTAHSVKTTKIYSRLMIFQQKFREINLSQKMTYSKLISRNIFRSRVNFLFLPHCSAHFYYSYSFINFWKISHLTKSGRGHIFWIRGLLCEKLPCLSSQGSMLSHTSVNFLWVEWCRLWKSKQAYYHLLGG